MDWSTIIARIFELCIISLLGVLTSVIVKWISVKQAEIQASSKNELVVKYTNLLAEIIKACVVSTNQTYVEVLKAENRFDITAQKTAFTKTYTNVMNILSSEAKVVLTEAYGDLSAYITSQIEAEVLYSK